MSARKDDDVVISNDSFKEIVFRALPCAALLDGCDLAVAYVSIHSPALDAVTTCPRSFGKRCPVADHLDRVRRTGSKADRSRAADIARVRREYWLPGVERGKLGTVERPNVRILRMTTSLHDELLDYITEDEGWINDITDADDGSCFRVSRQVDDGLVEYRLIQWYDGEPISHDPNMVKALKAVAKEFDVRAYFPPVDWRVLAQVHETLLTRSLARTLTGCTLRLR